MDERFDLENAIQTKADFSSAIAVMDKIRGWEEENWVGSRFAASMWIYTKTVMCNGQNNMQDCRLRWNGCAMPWMTMCGYLNSPNLVRKQNFWELCNTIRPCEPNHSPAGIVVVPGTNRSQSEGFRTMVRFTLPFGRMHTPRICFFLLRWIRAVLCRSLETDWDADREMRGNEDQNSDE